MSACALGADYAMVLQAACGGEDQCRVWCDVLGGACRCSRHLRAPAGARQEDGKALVRTWLPAATSDMKYVILISKYMFSISRRSHCPALTLKVSAKYETMCANLAQEPSAKAGSPEGYGGAQHRGVQAAMATHNQ